MFGWGWSNRNLILAATRRPVRGRQETPNYCLECGGNLSYDSAIKQYACKSCGLTFTSQDLLQGRERMFKAQESDDEKKKSRHKEYLKWWLSSDKKKS